MRELAHVLRYARCNERTRIGPLQINQRPTRPRGLAASFATAYVRRSYTHHRVGRRRPHRSAWRRRSDTRSRRRTSVNIVPPLVRRAARLFSQALLFVLVIATTARAQTGRITGIIADSAQGFPVSGVNVAVTGTTLGAIERRERPLHHCRGSARHLHARGAALGYAPVAARRRRRHGGSGDDRGLQGLCRPRCICRKRSSPASSIRPRAPRCRSRWDA